MGDSKDTLKALIPLLTYKEDRGWREKVEKNVQEWWQTVEDRANQPADPINPQLVIQRLSPRLPDRCILTADSGTSAFWFARNIRIRTGMMASLSGNLATMCPSVPYAIAAKFAYPDRLPVAITGDGAMQMLGMNELITISKYWKDWATPGLVIIVLNNRDLNMVTWEQRMLSGEPKFEASQDIPDLDYAAYARLLGLTGIRINAPAQIDQALQKVLESDRPAVLDVVCDPNVPIMPPHVDKKMLTQFSKAMMKGDAESSQIIRQIIRQAMQGGSTF
jgi:pyruvate dehydrogenase (quinone)